MPDRTVLDAYAARLISALGDPVRTQVSAPVRHDATERDRSTTQSLVREPPQLADRAIEQPLERSIAVPVFDESGETRDDQRPGSRSPKPGRANRWRIREGAHGELLYDPNPDAGDAA